jgi:hypothetical protein
MSNSAVRSAWQVIFNDATIQAYTTKIYNFDIRQRSTKEKALILYGEEVNFCTFLVGSSTKAETIGGGSIKEYLVDVTYYLEADTDGVNYNKCIDFFEALDTLVLNTLDSSWSGTVSYSKLPEFNLEITLEDVAERDAWKGNLRYTGVKFI